MRVIGVIPARWASSRFEGKVLADICGKPMIQHVIEQVNKCSLLDELIVACDDNRVKEVVESLDVKAVMTKPQLPSGTDRIAAAVKTEVADVIINIQADEPLIDPNVIDALAEIMVEDTSIKMGTVIKKISDEKDIDNPNVVKVVTDKNQFALYFSRAAIPFNRDNQQTEYFKHLGIYAYRKDFLLKFTQMPESVLERVEKLEQLRALENGVRIKTILTDADSIGVDVPDDIKRVERLLS